MQKQNIKGSLEGYKIGDRSNREDSLEKILQRYDNINVVSNLKRSKMIKKI